MTWTFGVVLAGGLALAIYWVTQSRKWALVGAGAVILLVWLSRFAARMGIALIYGMAGLFSGPPLKNRYSGSGEGSRRAARREVASEDMRMDQMMERIREKFDVG